MLFAVYPSLYVSVRNCLDNLSFWLFLYFSYEKCGCINPFRWSIRSIVLPGTDKAINVPFCAINNPCYAAAGSEFINIDSLWSNYCPDCTPECSTVDFNIKSSSLAAPPAFLFSDIEAFVKNSGVPVPDSLSTSCVNEIQSNYVSLMVSYETTRTELFTQQGTTEAVDVISNVGGQTGLWIGISFLSLMEIAEMLYRLLRRQCFTFRKTIRRRFTTNESSKL